MKNYFKFIEMTPTGYFQGQLLNTNLSEDKMKALLVALKITFNNVCQFRENFNPPIEPIDE